MERLGWSEDAFREIDIPLQGDSLPIIYGTVSAAWLHPILSSAQGPVIGYGVHSTCYGYLSKYSWCHRPLPDLLHEVAEHIWVTVCHRVMGILHELHARGVRTELLGLDDFCVRYDPCGNTSGGDARGSLSVALCDVDSCVVRKPNQSNGDWRNLIASSNEEDWLADQLEKLSGAKSAAEEDGQQFCGHQLNTTELG
ncbi:uncharacterized protein BP01DRAFT_385629 [Aspergillus saccharolyticus JOP 1030-1]|uniref:Protein kinase domain-containing protein n=1 Tax=Aspergillus saccharolyticus JOP 1030-1 TaxID=1450539 RepID=A0A318Z7B7_9EURO|nr:hypothetical protein BP01DRAFT_385629 [Aspergillus saccharolyticus JOP 1030-1]PYH42314.1 hypothetical protein BP01DRAFT_385629 [Aspergillus saccharolyticus JOP 1030-1]